MSLKEMELAIRQLQKNVAALASRPYTQRSEEAKAEAVKAQDEIKAVSDEAVENAITMADFMEEYYMQQYE